MAGLGLSRRTVSPAVLNRAVYRRLPARPALPQVMLIPTGNRDKIRELELRLARCRRDLNACRERTRQGR